MSYKVIVWKANGEVEKHPFESGATIQQILGILGSKELAIIGAVDNRLTESFEFDIYFDRSAKVRGEPLNHKATYCVNEFINRTSQNKLGRKEIYGDIAFEVKA